MDLELFKQIKNGRPVWYARDILHILGINFEELRDIISSIKCSPDFFYCEKNAQIDFCGTAKGGYLF